MDRIILTAVFVSLAGTIFGMAGKAYAVSRKSLKKSEFFTRVSVLFLILMFILLIFYRIIT